MSEAAARRPGFVERLLWAFSARVVAAPITVESVGIALYPGEFLRVGGMLCRVQRFDIPTGMIYVY